MFLSFGTVLKLYHSTLSFGEVLDRIKNSDKSGLVDEFYSDANAYTKRTEDLNNKYSVVEAFKYMNSEEIINECAWLNHRFVKFNLQDEYIGNRWLAYWYVRNLNIASNILELSGDDERVLVIYGNSHTRPLKEILRENHEIRVVSPLQYL